MVSGDSKNFVLGPPSFFGARDIIFRLVLSDAPATITLTNSTKHTSASTDNNNHR
jgi:hypothetical protein